MLQTTVRPCYRPLKIFASIIVWGALISNVPCSESGELPPCPQDSAPSSVRCVGVFDQTDGSRYLGEVLQGKKDGKGLLITKDGSRYEGGFVRGAREGVGALITEEGNLYSGDFKNDSFSGRGFLVLPNGSKFDGSFLNFRLHGQVEARYSNGDSYSGGYANGKRSGVGEYRWSDGSSFKGSWKLGLPIKGIQQSSDGSPLIGCAYLTVGKYAEDGRLLTDDTVQCRGGTRTDNRHQVEDTTRARSPKTENGFASKSTRIVAGLPRPTDADLSSRLIGAQTEVSEVAQISGIAQRDDGSGTSLSATIKEAGEVVTPFPDVVDRGRREEDFKSADRNMRRTIRLLVYQDHVCWTEGPDC